MVLIEAPKQKENYIKNMDLRFLNLLDCYNIVISRRIQKAMNEYIL